MAFCTTCAKARPIYTCTDTLNIGTVSQSGNYKVIITEQATGRCIMVDLENTDTISFPMPKLSKGHTYRIYVINADSEPVNITIGENTVECIDVEVVQAASGEPAEEQTIVLK